MFLKLFFISLVFIALAMVGIAIKILVKKNGKFSGTCASQNPYLNKAGENCGLCGKPVEKIRNCESDFQE